MHFMKISFISALFVLFSIANLIGDDFYVRSAGGNSNDNATWVDSLGVAKNAQPTAADDVFLNEDSGDFVIADDLNCRSFNTTNYTGRILHKSTKALFIGDGSAGAGDIALKFDEQTTYVAEDAIAYILFISSYNAVAQEVDFANKVTGNIEFNNSGKWKFTGAHTTRKDAKVTFTQGDINLNGQTFTWGKFSSAIAGHRTLEMGAANITLTVGANADAWDTTNVTNLTVPVNTATVTVLVRDNFNTTTTFKSASFDWNGLSIVFKIGENGGLVNTVANNTHGPKLDLGANSKIKNLTVISSNISREENIFKNTNDFEITGTLSLKGYSSSKRLRVYGNNKTITIPNNAGALDLANVDFQNTTLTDGGGVGIDISGIPGGSGDIGKNNNITFTTGTILYFYAGPTPNVIKKWSDASNWYFDSAHTQPANRYPLPQDNVRFDSNSFSTTGIIVYTDRNILGTDINWTGVQHNPTWQFGVVTVSHGDFILDSGMKVTASYGIEGDEYSRHSIGRLVDNPTEIKIDTKGVSLPFTRFYIGYTKDIISYNSVANELKLLSDLTVPNAELYLYSKVFLNSHTVSADYFHTDGSSNVDFGSATIKLTSHNYISYPHTPTVRTPIALGGTITAGTSTIELADTTPLPKTIDLGGKTVNNIKISSTQRATYIFTSGATIKNFIDETEAGHTYLFTGTTKFVDSIKIKGNTDHPAYLASQTSGTAFTWNLDDNPIVMTVDYAWVSDSTLTNTGNTNFTAVTNSVNINNNTSWTGLSAITTIPNTKRWTDGHSTGVWSDAANWDGGTLPGQNDIVVFFGGATNPCMIDTSVDVKGIRILSGYTGTINQNANDITIGTAGLEIWHGTFLGNTNPITSTGPVRRLYGTLTLTPNVLTITAQGNSQMTFYSSLNGTLTHNSCTVDFVGTLDAFIYSPPSLNNVVINTTGNIEGRFDAKDFTRNEDGALNAYVSITGDYLGTGGDKDNIGTGAIVFRGTTQTATNPHFPTTYFVIGARTITIAAVGDIYCNGSWRNDPINTFTWNNNKVIFLPSANKRLSQIKQGRFYDLEIDMVDSVDPTTRTAIDIAHESIVTNNLILKSVNVLQRYSPAAKITVQGSVINQTTTPWSSDVRIIMLGSADTTYSGTGVLNAPLEIRKDSGKKVTLSSNLNMSETQQYLKVTSGILDLNGKNVNVAHSFSVEDTLTLTGEETITVNGSTSQASVNPAFVIDDTSSTIIYKDDTKTANITKLTKSFHNLTLGAKKTHELDTTLANQVTIKGTFTSDGDNANRSILRSTNDDTGNWFLKLLGISTLGDKVIVKNSDATNGKPVKALHSVKVGAALNWVDLDTAPFITSITSTTTNGVYGVGKPITIKITFNENVTLSAGTLKIDLNSGGSVTLLPADLDGSVNNVTKTYTVATGHSATKLSATAVTITGGTLQNSISVDAILTLPTGSNIDDSKNIQIDTIAPTITAITSSTADGIYKAGDAINLTVNFSKSVTGTSLTFILNNGASVTLTSISGTSVSGTYTIAAGGDTTKLNVTGISVSGTVQDSGGNNLVTTLPATNLDTSKSIAIDTTVPSITTKVLGANNAYVDITFSEPVYAANNKTGGLDIDDFALTFNANSGSATAAEITAVTKTNGSATQGAETTVRLTLAITGNTSGAETITITPKEDSIFDAVGNAAATTTTTGAITLYKVEIEKPAPNVTKVDADTNNGTYKKGDTITINVRFDQNVVVTGNPKINLGDGREATYSGGSGTSVITFVYTVQEGDGDNITLDYPDTTALNTNNGSIKGTNGETAVLVLPEPGSENSLGAIQLKIDGTAPTILQVGNTIGDSIYGPGSTMAITVTFSENVTVTGTPTLLLDIGEAGSPARYANGSGTSVLTFHYIVEEGVNLTNLDYVSKNALTLKENESIQDIAGNDADLTLPEPGSNHSLSANAQITIDTLAPTILQATLATDNSYVDIDFSEAVFTGIGTGAVAPSHFGITIEGNSELTISISSIVSPTDTALIGGETKIRAYISVDGTVKGNETLQITVASDTFFDKVGNAMEPITKTFTLKAPSPENPEAGKQSSKGGCQYAEDATLTSNFDMVLLLSVFGLVAFFHRRRQIEK